MKSVYLTEKIEGKGLKVIAGSSIDLVLKSSAAGTVVPADIRQIGQKAAAAVAVVFDIHFSPGV